MKFKPTDHKGFALVATISIMSLVVMIALAMVTLATSSVRTSAHSAHLEIAKANARLAIAEAISNLQEAMGPDQRICANASILDTDTATSEIIEGVNQSKWLGVWNSSPATPTYEKGRNTMFRKWLVSSSNQNEFTEASTATLDTNNAIFLGEKSSLSDTGLWAPKTSIDSGSFAWAVIDNTQKGNAKVATTSNNSYSNYLNRTVPPRHAVEKINTLDSYNPNQSEKSITTDSVALALDSRPTDNFWKSSVTANSQHLLTNVKSGGLKKDLNTLLELDRDSTDWSSIGYGVWNSNGFATNADNYIFKKTKAKGATWAQLHSYYNLYKGLSWGSSDVTAVQARPELIDWHLADRNIDYGDPTGGHLFPRVAKVLYVYSYESKATGSTTATGEDEYEISLVCNVFIAMWNPYNVRIELPANTSPLVKLASGVPMQFDWQVDGTSVGKSTFQDVWNASYPSLPSEEKVYASNIFYIYAFLKDTVDATSFSMDPGETRLFSMSNTHPNYQTNTYMTTFTKGVDYGSGVKLTKILPAAQSLKVGASQKIQVGMSPIDNMNARYGNSQHASFWIFDENRRWPYYERRGLITADGNVGFTNVMNNIPAADTTSRTATELEGDRQPFGSFIMEVKTANDNETPNLPFIHSGLNRLSSKYINDPASLANERLQYRVEEVNSWDNDILQVSLSNNPHGADHIFIGGGTGFGSGHTHVVSKGLPLMAPTSIAEFMHAGVGDGADNIEATAGKTLTAKAPFYDLAVGNSFAHPLLESDKEENGDRFDYSYKINSILWDDYFCSSLAPRYSPMVTSEQTISEVWENFRTHTATLTNSRFQLTQDHDALRSTSIVDSSDNLTTGAHQKLASYLSYSGGFNVNSVSVDAWRTFLAGAQNDNIKVYDLFNGAQLLTDEQLTDGKVPFSRTSLPCASSIRSNILENDYLGYRALTSTEIDALAEAIVVQVKTRGPFLNMSDFINRQLNSSDTSLALSGTLQAAIDSTSINEDTKSSMNVTAADTAGLGYAFDQAAHGNTAIGSPGWLVQADLLVSLGSSIFVRGDTFTIRSYGESRDTNGNIIASVYAEAVVQRSISYVDSSDEPTVATADLSDMNTTFGRRFNMIQFRWIQPEELN